MLTQNFIHRAAQQDRPWLTAGLLLIALSVWAPASVQAASVSPKEKLEAAYQDALKTLKDDDDAGFLRLYSWCQANKLSDEADVSLNKYRSIYYSKKVPALDEKPTKEAFQSLISWCKQYNWTQKADELNQRLLAFDYSDRKAKLKPDDVAALETLAGWCKTNGLSKQANETYQAIVKLKPDHIKARAELGQIKLGDAWVDEEELGKRYVALAAEKRVEFFASVQKAGYKGAQADLEKFAVWAGAPKGLLKNQKVPGHSETDAWYHISVPADYDAFKEPLPLVIYLHGGSDKDGSADDMVATASFKVYEHCVVLYPNHLKGLWGWCGKKEMLYVLDMFTDVLSKWRVDRHRIYLTGGSMGGNGTWGIGTQMHEMFAGVSPQSGWWETWLEFPMANLIDKPVYILHGTKDSTVPIDSARNANQALQKLGAKNVQLKEVDCGHQPPNDELEKAVTWLLAYRNADEFSLSALRDRISKLKKPPKVMPGSWE